MINKNPYEIQIKKKDFFLMKYTTAMQIYINMMQFISIEMSKLASHTL